MPIPRQLKYRPAGLCLRKMQLQISVIVPPPQTTLTLCKFVFVKCWHNFAHTAVSVPGRASPWPGTGETVAANTCCVSPSAFYLSFLLIHDICAQLLIAASIFCFQSRVVSTSSRTVMRQHKTGELQRAPRWVTDHQHYEKQKVRQLNAEKSSR